MSYDRENLPFFSRPIDRRGFLKLLSIMAILPIGCSYDGWLSDGVKVNDVHARINQTKLKELIEPEGRKTLTRTINRAKDEGTPISISGSRHAMGGQQFGEETINFDTRSLDKILDLDRENGLVKVEAGIQWPKLIKGLRQRQQDGSTIWTINQKQTGADRLTIGGAVSANAHGRRLNDKPMVQDVKALTLVDADGKTRRCSRSQNEELFSLVVGGYGLFGPIYSVQLRLRKLRKVERKVTVESVDGIMDRFNERISQGFGYGDFQFSVDHTSDGFLREGVFSCYRPVDDNRKVPEDRKELSDRDWMELVYLAHENESKVFKKYVNYYLSTDGQVYWSDRHQLSTYVRDYHNLIERYTESLPDGTEIITELYVPREKLPQFMKEAAKFLREKNAELIYGTVRLIKKDDVTFLPWARNDFACVIFNLHVKHSEEGFRRARNQFRGLIDMALGYGGSFFLTYHRWATLDQIKKAYPEFRQFLELKQKYDPDERFRSEWYRHYKQKFL